MMSPHTSSELERMRRCGSSVWTITRGLRGSLTSTPVKFLGADSWASHRMRLPSLASCRLMPSPTPPWPAKVSWAIRRMLKASSPLIRHSTALPAHGRLGLYWSHDANRPRRAMHQSNRQNNSGVTRRMTLTGLGAAAAVAAGGAQAAKGPLVWLDMDQQALDAAYDQQAYAPNRDQV